MKNQERHRGFTVIELIVVISILAILSGVLVPRVTNHMKSARDARRLARGVRLPRALARLDGRPCRHGVRGEPRFAARSAAGQNRAGRALREKTMTQELARNPLLVMRLRGSQSVMGAQHGALLRTSGGYEDAIACARTHGLKLPSLA